MVGCGRHGGERPNLPGRDGASAIVEGHVLQSMAVWAGGVKPFLLVSFSCDYVDPKFLSAQSLEKLRW